MELEWSRCFIVSVDSYTVAKALHFSRRPEEAEDGKKQGPLHSLAERFGFSAVFWFLPSENARTPQKSTSNH